MRKIELRRSMRRFLTAFGLAAAACLGAAPLAPGSAAPEIIEPDGTLSVPVKRGRLIRLDRPAAAVFVADPQIADVQAHSPNLVYLFGLNAGVTSLYAVDEADRVLLRRDVTVTHETGALDRTLDAIAPGSGVEIESIDGGLVLSGSVRDPAVVEEIRQIAEAFLGDDETLINRISVTAPTQVNIRVHVAEISRAVTKEFGINWESLFSVGNFIFGFVSGRDVVGVDGSFTRSPSSANFVGVGHQSGDTNINALIDALEDENLATVLAEPSLTAVSGETASFLAGGEFPIPTRGTDGQIDVDFKQFGVSLSFTPTVLTDNRINLKIRPEVSNLSAQGAVVIDNLTIQALATRRAETTVEMASGQSLAIGGLISSDLSNAISRFPWLGSLPILGPLFRSSTFERNESELVIFVTPIVVEPTRDQLQLPTDGLRAPNDVERILEGRLNKPNVSTGAPPVALPSAGLAGSVGFALD